MAKKIENHRYSIEEAFRNCFYIVPDYQREYVWTEKEVLQLLEDINEQIQGVNEYFIGMILVSPTKDNNHFEVIDGQQRLTTFFLLLCALKQLFRGEGHQQTFNELISTSYTDSDGEIRSSLKLDPRYENASEVMNKIVKLDDEPQEVRVKIQASGIGTYGSIANLINAYSTVYQYAKDNYSDNNKLKKYWGYLANKVVFIQISTEVSSALKIFETINERGVGLNPMDLLKNLLFTHVGKGEFSRLKDDWKKITGPLEKNKEKPLRFLRYFLMANYPIKNDRSDSVVREDEIYEWFTHKPNAELCNYAREPFEFVRKLTKSVENYIHFTNGNGPDGQTSLAMDSLKRLCGSAFSLHYILLLATANFPKNLFETFVSKLEDFLFYYIFTKTPTKDLERNFSIWADELREISNESKHEQQEKKLHSFITERFHKNMKSKEGELQDALKRYNLYSMQQYRTRYLLARLTQYVDMAYKGVKTRGSLEEYAKYEIEHILPDTPNTELLAAFEADNPKASYEEYKNRLGNLTLLEKPINIVAGRNFFNEKCREYKKSKLYLTSSIAEINVVGKDTSINRINEKITAFDKWNIDSIYKRQNMLSSLVFHIMDS